MLKVSKETVPFNMWVHQIFTRLWYETGKNNKIK